MAIRLQEILSFSLVSEVFNVKIDCFIKISIASHTVNLKKFIHSNQMTEEGIEAYQEVRINPHFYLNPFFELIDIHTGPRNEEEEGQLLDEQVLFFDSDEELEFEGEVNDEEAAE